MRAYLSFLSTLLLIFSINCVILYKNKEKYHKITSFLSNNSVFLLLEHVLPSRCGKDDLCG